MRVDVICVSNGCCDVVGHLVKTALWPLSFAWKVLVGRVSPKKMQGSPPSSPRRHYWNHTIVPWAFWPQAIDQHDRRGRGVPTLTWEEVTIREGKRSCCSWSKKEIMSLGFYLKVISKSACEELCILQCQQCQKVGVGTSPMSKRILSRTRSLRTW